MGRPRIVFSDLSEVGRLHGVREELLRSCEELENLTVEDV